MIERGGRTWSVLDAGTGRLLGNVGVPRVAPADGVAEVGYWVAPWARRQRVAARAAVAATKWAFAHGSGRVELMTDVRNTPSQRVAIAAGFVRESVRTSAGTDRDGSRTDLICWRRLPGDPDGPSKRLLPDLRPRVSPTESSSSVRPFPATLRVCWSVSGTRRPSAGCSSRVS
ncbi:GNAT family N-acetyltransferase [Fodinicola feengrottensis]|uniref:GNAT family N-acetyltransferase n=1 Tax=Fodinicola feengrottensis TaxID=435914 RepID=UPI0024431A1D|nr:GNAT family protein [Fodinicola feengrottensis]